MKSLHFKPRTLVIIGIILPSLLVGFPAILAFYTENQMEKSFAWVTHTFEVEKAIQSVLTSLADAETGQRGYLITSGENYLEPYNRAVKDLPDEVKHLRELTMENEAQQNFLNQLDGLVETRLALLSEGLELNRTGKKEQAWRVVESGQGRNAMRELRSILGEMKSLEKELLNERQQQLSVRTKHNNILLLSLVILSAVFSTAILFLLHRLSKLGTLVTMCAWSRTIEYEGEWLSFEQYLAKRFQIRTSHGISPAEAERLSKMIQQPEKAA